ncbi:TRAP transporter substrate-binding protein [Sandaracinus amylolyticus]|uniref:Putative N-acetylneuraminate-binding protein n=1 Tax=Sandaracinus amylolyticus TaxID=927083 RepID=A0A0F6W4Q8_9BACT|nr:TRAP transporter substrate-binding protein [Sandaracinus amylolyticus]AKF07431.1 Putative N-acetylneuraminate-binding protein [Sandaracinus amylolyticus]
MNRKKLAITLTTLSVVLSAFLVTLAPREEAHAQEAIQMRIGTVAPEGTPWEKQLRSLKTHIESQSGGRIKVRLFMGGSLGGEKALVRRVSQGSLEAFGGSTAALGSVVPELNVIEAPYLFDTAEQADRALDSAPVREQVGRLVSAKGFTFALWAENGFRSWFTRERPIRQPADLRGLRMRSQESRVHIATYEAFGATPNPIDVTNVLTSLQTGVVDGFDNTPLFAFATSWYQAARHLNLSEQSYQPGIVVFSQTWFNGLPDDLKQMLSSLPVALTTDGRAAVRRMDPILIQNLQRYGIDVHRPTPTEREAFAAIGRPVQDRVAEGAAARTLLKALRTGRGQ